MSNISDITSDDESIEKEAPLLYSIPKENPFSVPENYFDSLPSEIMEKCQGEVVSGQWSVASQNLKSYFLNLKYLVLGYKWRLLTSVGCVAIICIFTMRMGNRSASYEALAQNIPDSLIVEHLENNITDISVSSLEDISEGIPENNSSSAKNVSDSTNADQDIIAYLMNNNVSVSDIVNE